MLLLTQGYAAAIVLWIIIVHPVEFVSVNINKNLFSILQKLRLYNTRAIALPVQPKR